VSCICPGSFPGAGSPISVAVLSKRPAIGYQSILARLTFARYGKTVGR
jgi:hypothetical protein